MSEHGTEDYVWVRIAALEADLEAANIRATEAEAQEAKTADYWIGAANDTLKRIEQVTTERDDALAGLREAVAALRFYRDGATCPELSIAGVALASLESRFAALVEPTPQNAQEGT